MTLNSRVNSLLERLSRNVADFSTQSQEIIDRTDQSANDTELSAQGLRTAQQNRVASPEQSLRILSQFITTSPGAAFGAGILADDVDFANFVNSRIDDARENLAFAFQERQADRLDNQLISDLARQQLDAANLPITTEFNAVESQLDRDSALSRIQEQGRQQRATEQVRAQNRQDRNPRLTQSEINTNNSAAIATLNNLSSSIQSGQVVPEDVAIATQDFTSLLNDFGPANSAQLLVEKDGESVISSLEGLTDNIKNRIANLSHEQQTIQEDETGLFSSFGADERNRRAQSIQAELDSYNAFIGTLFNDIQNSNLSDQAKTALNLRLSSIFEE